jgi:hypothetical protein
MEWSELREYADRPVELPVVADIRVDLARDILTTVSREPVWLRFDGKDALSGLSVGNLRQQIPLSARPKGICRRNLPICQQTQWNVVVIT